MPVIDIPSTNLDNVSDVIQWLRDELVTNHHFVERRNNGTILGNDKEIWVERAAVDTYHGDAPLLIGLRQLAAGTNESGNFEHTMSYLDWATASAAGANSWDNILGTYSNAGTTSFPCRSNRWLQGSPYVRGRLITSPTSNNASPDEPLYFYLVVEVETGFYRSVGWGEVVKLAPFTGGMFMLNSHWPSNRGVVNPDDLQLFGAGTTQTVLATFTSPRCPGAVWSSDWQDDPDPLTNANNRGWMPLGGGSSSSGGWPCGGMSPAGPLAHLIGFSPSGFSLQSQRWPQLIFGPIARNFGTSPGYQGHAPMCIIPDVFPADITSVDAYSVFQDDFGERYMVVPYHTKTGEGADSSEKWGFLIRNPDLVVT